MNRYAKYLGKTRSRRRPAILSKVTDGRLRDYSVAAAGVGALALAAPAQATIVSSTPNLTIPINGVTPTYAPIPAFPQAIKIVAYSGDSSSGVNLIPSSATPAFFGGSLSARIAPASAGLHVPTGLTRFTGNQTLVSSSSSSSDTNFLGANKYVGFSVGSGSNIHYGWLKFTITQDDGYIVVLNQVALEQCAGQPITIGTSSGGATCLPTTPAPSSLWLMSLGVAGLAGLEALRRLRETGVKSR